MTKNVELARERLLNILPKNGTCAEVGSWKGDFSQKILEATQPQQLTLIDPYKFFGEYENAWYGGQAGGQQKMDDIFNAVNTRFAPEMEQGRLRILRMNSDQGINELENASMDWIYVDGNHTYEFVKTDLELSWNKIKTNGYLTGDDYGIVGWWEDGVTKAVNEFIGKHFNRLRIIYFEESQFVLQKLA